MNAVFESRIIIIIIIIIIICDGERWGRTEMFTEYYYPKNCRRKNDTGTYLQIEDTI